MENEQTESIELTPDYESMFRNMLRETRNQSDIRTMFDAYDDADRAELMRQVQRWFAPLTIAANCATTVDAVNELRTAMTDMLGAIDQEAARLERVADETVYVTPFVLDRLVGMDWDDPTDGKGIL